MFVVNETVAAKPRHHWLRPIRAAFVTGPVSPLMAEMIEGLQTHLVQLGHEIQDVPDDTTDVVLTTAPYGTALTWRKALFFTERQRYKLSHQPTMVSMVHITPAQLDELTAQMERAIAKEPPDPEDFEFPGLAPGAYRVLVEQGRRGGPILALQRLLQVQAMSLRVLLVVGDKHPEAVYHFDLVGAYPVTRADQPAGAAAQLPGRWQLADRRGRQRRSLIHNLLENNMWYFAWILGVGFAVLLAILNAMWGETEEARKAARGSEP